MFLRVLMLLNFSEEKMNLVLREVPFESLIRHLEKSDERVILNVLTLMNSLYNKARDHVKNDIIEVRVDIFSSHKNTL